MVIKVSLVLLRPLRPTYDNLARYNSLNISTMNFVRHADVIFSVLFRRMMFLIVQPPGDETFDINSKNFDRYHLHFLWIYWRRDVFLLGFAVLISRTGTCFDRLVLQQTEQAWGMSQLCEGHYWYRLALLRDTPQSIFEKLLGKRGYDNSSLRPMAMWGRG